jgi:hypothetical protein
VGVIFHLPFHEGLFGGAKERLRGGGARWRSSYREKAAPPPMRAISS